MDQMQAQIKNSLKHFENFTQNEIIAIAMNSMQNKCFDPPQKRFLLYRTIHNGIQRFNKS